MQELKFKLRLEELFVGYLEIRPAIVVWRDRDDAVMDTPILFDAIHPFVCQDKSGKDVYEGDRVFVTGPNAHACVLYDGRSMQWHLGHLDFCPYVTVPVASHQSRIEVVEEVDYDSERIRL